MCCFVSRFGHNRAKNDLGVVFLNQAVNRLCDFVYAVVGLQTVLGVGGECFVCLKNLVGLGTTQIELEGWISSPQQLNSTRREVRA